MCVNLFNNCLCTKICTIFFSKDSPPLMSDDKKFVMIHVLNVSDDFNRFNKYVYLLTLLSKLPK